MYYQPIVEPRTERTVGYEALVRWIRPGHGVVNPDAFIPFAERSDLIIAIDQWVLGAVARQIARWDQAGMFERIPVSINISGRHLAAPDFVEHVLTPLDDAGIDPARITIEVTESALLEDLTSAALKLQQLRDRGIRTAIDDFGTGYTSLAHLKSLPIDILKIDRSFANDSSAASLVQLIIDTGHLLGATVTAEGVETRNQAETLGVMGTDELQGYLYGRPVAATDLVDGRQPSTNGSRPC
jgi:EAL domain-containing protein (putative c-di-GMP-specific phosphodiesterase class I)